MTIETNALALRQQILARDKHAGIDAYGIVTVLQNAGSYCPFCCSSSGHTSTCYLVNPA